MNECVGGASGQLPKHRLQLLRLECVSVLSQLTATGCRKHSQGLGGKQGPELTAASSFPWHRHLEAPEDRLSCSEGTDKCNHTV